MTRQSNEDPAVSAGQRKLLRTQSFEGEKGIPVIEQATQLELFTVTAANSYAKANETIGEEVARRSVSSTYVVPMSANKNERVSSATMEEVALHLAGSFEKVAKNRGAPGPDGRSIEEVRKHLSELLPELTSQLLSGKYTPGALRRVWLPKAGGGQRGLGIPNVVDRMVQEAVRRVIEPLYEPTFHASSHGFRPSRSCQTAIEEAKGYVDEGNEWVVDIDLKKFFDRVHHQRLMSKLAQRVDDKRLLVLIGRWLRAEVILPDGLKLTRGQGTPQGGPLSPLLSNIVLDELDSELAQRGHRFVRYADDCNIYVRSERAGNRVMKSVSKFIERRLRLEVNSDKSAVARTEERHFVGFELRRMPMDGTIEVMPSERSKKRFFERIVRMTPRNWGRSLRECIRQLNVFLEGWFSFFRHCTERGKRVLLRMDARIRRRLRAIQLKHWKRRATIAKRLTSLGVKRQTAWSRVYRGSKSWWALSLDYAVHRGLSNAYYAEHGLVSLQHLWTQLHEHIDASGQLRLALR